MTFRFSAISTLFLLIKCIKNLSKVFMQQYNYPKLIWMKQNVSFACSNYRSNWQLIDNFCSHLNEPNCIETWRKRIVNWIMTTEPRYTIISVNRFTSKTKAVFMQVCRTAGHVRQKPPRSDKYFRIAGHVVWWNFRAKTGVEIVIFVQRTECQPVSKRSTNQNTCYKKHDQLVTGALSLKHVDPFIYRH